MAEYNMIHTGAELDEAVQAVLDGWRDVSPVTARASDVVWGRVIVTPEGPVTGTFQGVVPPASWRKTASGATVTVSDGMAGWPLHSLAAEIRPVQAGSGTPSPDNVRPITGHTGVTVTQNGEAAVSVTFPDEPGTVYGGAVDLKAGTLTVTGIVISGDSLPATWTKYDQSGGKRRFYSNYVSLALEAYSGITNCKLICSHFRLPTSAVYDAAEGNSAWYTLSGTGASYRLHCVLPDRTIETGAAFRAWLVENGVQFYLSLANPVVYQIAIQEMPALTSGENTFSADTGDVTVVYYSLPDDPVNPTVNVQSTAVTLTRPDMTLDVLEPEDAILEDDPEEVSE